MRKPHPDTGFISIDRPAGSINLEDVAQADYALERALEHGDYVPLLARMRAGKGLPAEQELLADIYEKKVKRPAHRMKQNPEALRFRDLCLALCVLNRRLKGLMLKPAVMDTANEMGVGKSTVYAATEQHRDLFRRCGFSK
jgi:hypothetical protein